MRVAVYGGSFNPPHLGHIDAARVASETLQTDKLIFIPVAKPPHKALSDDAPDVYERLELTRLAAKSVPLAEASDIEIARGGESYTADTLDALIKEYPESEIFFLMGTDMIESFENWSGFERILALCILAPFVRGEGEEQRLNLVSERLCEKYGAKIALIEKKPIEVSSTQIRKELKTGGGREYLSPEVYARIIKGRLYGALPDLEWLRQQAYAMLEPKRIPHVAGTEKAAVSLARHWGVNERDAAEAAILHDITKKLSWREQLILCGEHGIIIDSVEEEAPKLLHAKTGAMLARKMFGSPDHIYNAVLYHTTGRADMTALEKIIYLADYIEENRDFDGLTELRRLAYDDLDAAMALGIGMSIKDLKDKGSKLHSRTLEALGAYAVQRG